MNDILLYTSYKLKLKLKNLRYKHSTLKKIKKTLLQSCEWHFVQVTTESLNYEQRFLKLRQTFCYRVVDNILICTSHKLKSKT